eukprot:4806147-Amphidinium_carterae.1
MHEITGVFGTSEYIQGGSTIDRAYRQLKRVLKALWLTQTLVLVDSQNDFGRSVSSPICRKGASSS